MPDPLNRNPIYVHLKGTFKYNLEYHEQYKEKLPLYFYLKNCPLKVNPYTMAVIKLSVVIQKSIIES